MMRTDAGGIYCFGICIRRGKNVMNAYFPKYPPSTGMTAPVM